LSDRDLAARLERAQYAGFAAMAADLDRLEPTLRMHVSRPRGGCLFIMGAGWPVNRAYGLAMDGPVDDAFLEEIEDVFRSAGVAPEIETCPLEHPSLTDRLAARGYRPGAVTRVFAMPPRSRFEPVTGVDLERVDPTLAPVYETTVARGFVDADDGEPGAGARSFARAAARAHAWLARIDGEPAGGGAAGITEGVAGLYGASTLPRFRRRGVQRALLAARVDAASDLGADVVTVLTNPETGSERNVRRAGFRVIHDQVVWKRPAVVRGSDSGKVA
jgi:GNAT superfamily N-acetyltransferase